MKKFYFLIMAVFCITACNPKVKDITIDREISEIIVRDFSCIKSVDSTAIYCGTQVTLNHDIADCEIEPMYTVTSVENVFKLSNNFYIFYRDFVADTCIVKEVNDYKGNFTDVILDSVKVNFQDALNLYKNSDITQIEGNKITLCQFINDSEFVNPLYIIEQSDTSSVVIDAITGEVNIMN